MRLKVKIFTIFLAMAILSGYGLCSEGLAAKTSSNKTNKNEVYVNIIQVVDYFGMNYEFDEWAGVLTIKEGSQILKLQIGRSIFIYRNRVYLSTLPALMERGGIFVSSDVVDFMLKRIVRKRIEWRIEDRNFVVANWQSREDVRGTRQETNRSTLPQRDIDVIVIDPGHGGKDPGGIGYNGIKEKDVVLEISKALKREIRRQFNKKVIMTRKDDSFVSLEERSKIANGANNGGNSIFVSVHANVAIDKSSGGFESYYLSLHPFGEHARDVAEIENAVINYENKPYADYLKEVLNRVVDVEYRKESMRLASYINQGIARMVNEVSTNRGVKGAFFYVLKESKMVAVLIEVGFITNEKEAKLLTNKEYQVKLAKGMASGIMDFVQEFEKTNGFTRGY